MNVIRKWLTAIRLGSIRIDHTEGTMAIPTVQNEDLSDEEQFRREHGYSKARVPLPWSEDISKHNAEVDAEYNAEIGRRKVLMLAGEYKPRWVLYGLDVLPDPTNPDHVDWHLEMSMDPGRRVNVTKDVGVPMQPMVSDDEMAQRRAVGRLRRGLSVLDPTNPAKVPATVRALIGSRYKVLEECHWNETLADQVEAAACKTFGVASVDAPLPSGVSQ